MGRGTTRRPKAKERGGRPSLFFIVALVIGVALLIWVFTQVISRPVTPHRGSIPAAPMARIVPV